MPLGSWKTASSWKISSIAERRRTGSLSPNTSWRLRSNKVDTVEDMILLRSIPSSDCTVSTRNGSVAGRALGGLVCAVTRAPLTNAAAPAAKATAYLRGITVFLDLGGMVSLTSTNGVFESALAGIVWPATTQSASRPRRSDSDHRAWQHGRCRAMGSDKR